MLTRPIPSASVMSTVDEQLAMCAPTFALARVQELTFMAATQADRNTVVTGVADGPALDLADLRAAELARAQSEHRRRLAIRTAALVGMLAIWWGASAANTYVFQTVNPNLLPDPLAVLSEGARAWARGTLQRDIIASLLRVLQGFLIAAILGVLAGTVVARVALLRDILEPVIDLLRPIPPLAFLPLLVLYLGIGNTSKIAFIAYSAFFPIFTTTREGMKYVDPLLVRAAESLGASRRQILWHVVAPSAIPSMLTGLRLGLSLSFFVIIAAEFIAASEGLGYLINDAREFFRVDRMLLGASIIGLLGYSFNQVFSRVEKRLLRWKA